MYDRFKVIFIDDSLLGYRLKNRYLVARFTGADSKQTPIYNVVKKFRTEQAATRYIQQNGVEPLSN